MLHPCCQLLKRGRPHDSELIGVDPTTVGGRGSGNFRGGVSCQANCTSLKTWHAHLVLPFPFQTSACMHQSHTSACTCRALLQGLLGLADWLLAEGQQGVPSMAYVHPEIEIGRSRALRPDSLHHARAKHGSTCSLKGAAFDAQPSCRYRVGDSQTPSFVACL